MMSDNIRAILKNLMEKKCSMDDAIQGLQGDAYLDFNIAKHDISRSKRSGFDEVIFCEGKDESHIIDIISQLIDNKKNVVGTRASEHLLEKIESKFVKIKVNPLSRTFQLIHDVNPKLNKQLGICCAGTADISVAEEAADIAEFYGIDVNRYYDIGVAGLHRLLDQLDNLRQNDCLIVIAGMEGALPSVIGGLVAMPIIAVPTSVGYGSHLGGITPLFAMLNTCSEGITVVNIDNGFGAACAAKRILSHTG